VYHEAARKDSVVLSYIVRMLRTKTLTRLFFINTTWT